jgi:Na+/phosphate symporter
MLIYLSLLVAVGGLLLYVLSEKLKLAEIGRISFFCGLLAFLLQVVPHMVGLLK